MENNELLTFAKESKCDSYKYLGLFHDQKAYRIYDSSIEKDLTEGAILGLPHIVIETKNGFKTLRGDELLDAMHILFKRDRIS